MIIQKFHFEKRAYTEDASAEEIQAIKDRVYVYDPTIIYYDELPVLSPFSITLMFDQIDLLGRQLGQHGLLVDLRDTKRPDAPTRRAINQRFKSLCENLSHVSFCTGKNFLINTAAKFVMFQTNLDSYSINKTLEQAIIDIKNKTSNVR